jgi:AraC-like DNA-binding protein
MPPSEIAADNVAPTPGAPGDATRPPIPEHARRWREAFRDVDRSEAAVGQVFHPHSITVSGGDEPFACTLDAAGSGPLILGELDYTVDMRLWCPHVEGYHVNVPIRGVLDSASGRDELHVLPGSAALYQPEVSALLGTTVRTGFSMFALKIDKQALEAAMECLTGRPTEGSIRLAPLLDISSGLGRQWWEMTMAFRRQVAGGDLLAHPLVARPAGEAILNGLLLASGHQFSEFLHGGESPTPVAIRRALHYIGDHLREPITLAALSRASGASVRALQRGFQQHLGMTPTQYIRARRLEHAHADLISLEPGDLRVAAIAARWGFTNQGRFAAEYRRRYGRSPAQTSGRCAPKAR